MMTLEEKFQQYHANNPHVYVQFKHFAFQALMAGHHQFGAKAIMERVRWEVAFTTTGDSFKINNSYVSRYARMLIEDYPQFEGFFKTRKLKGI